ncbi:DUF4097 family beta strand repeat-containing protein [Nonomuraea sp. LPB2021202275-12-8]|uniref:DUF4097 family beta strand repeat-containing protein n=1 Tax=Nonomuraea sp. LPB2021202275-12-8 TaxID=3120159 RepID=UPI00300D8E23
MRTSGVIAGSLALAALLAGCGIAGPLQEDTASYDVTEKVTALQVETDAGDIEVIESDRQGIHVTERITWRKNKPVTSHGTRGGTLTLAFTCPGGWMGDAGCDVGYQVEIPRGLRVKAVSDSGKVTLQDLSGDVEANSDSGTIEAEGLTGKQVATKTDSGDITLTFTAQPGKVETKTDSGTSVVRVPQGPYKVALTTDSGNKKIDTVHDPAAPRSITMSSDSGDVEVLGS